MNNKGFAITTILYGTLILFCMLLVSMLGILSNYKHNLELLIDSLNGTRDIVELRYAEATFDTGMNVNIKMKNLAGDDTSVDGEKTGDTNISAILYSPTKPNIDDMTDDNIVSTPDSEYPIYMWYDNGTIYWWSMDKTPSLNNNASTMFRQLSNLTDISGLTNFDASAATSFAGLFMGHSTYGGAMHIVSLAPLAGWDTSNVDSMRAMFQQCTDIISINDLQGWDTSKVTDMQYMFSKATSLQSLSGVDGWTVSSVKTMDYMFVNCTSLTNLGDLSNWDVHSATSMKATFKNLTGLTDASAINGWNITGVTNFSEMFLNTPVHPEFTQVLGTWDGEGTFTPNS